MKLLLTTLAPLSVAHTHAPRPVRAIPDFLGAGYEVYLAAPLAGRAADIRAAWGVRGVLPLLPTLPGGWARLALNAYRVATWSKRWQPEIYLSLGGEGAWLAHSGRGSAGGYGLSVLVLPTLRWQGRGPGAWLERRAITECDRLITHDPDLADTLIAHYGARGGDTTLLPGDETAPFVTLCQHFLTEPPGFP